MVEIPYIGNELDLFEKATAWKKYYGRFLRQYLKGKVLEVGAGTGGTTRELCDGTQQSWLCLEPDPHLYSRLENRIRERQLPVCCSSVKGVTADLTSLEKFNAIIYIDVIEHIEKDKEELLRAKTLLASDGYLIVLVPAHQFLYSEFDKAIGHYRRYNKKMLIDAAPEGLKLCKIFYLDSCGLFTSLANKYFLKQDYPTAKQISFWDRFIVPVSRSVDFILNYNAGKTVVSIWQN
jgi:SAM-dependent methyltransferase